MTELVETEVEYVKKLRHVCEVGIVLLTGHYNNDLLLTELHWRDRDVRRIAWGLGGQKEPSFLKH